MSCSLRSSRSWRERKKPWETRRGLLPGLLLPSSLLRSSAPGDRAEQMRSRTGVRRKQGTIRKERKRKRKILFTLSPAVHVPPWNSTATAGGRRPFSSSLLLLSASTGSHRSATCLSLGPYLSPSSNLPSFLALLLSDSARSANGTRKTCPVSSSAMSLACLAAVERRVEKSGQSRSSAFVFYFFAEEEVEVLSRLRRRFGDRTKNKLFLFLSLLSYHPALERLYEDDHLNVRALPRWREK